RQFAAYAVSAVVRAAGGGERCDQRGDGGLSAAVPACADSGFHSDRLVPGHDQSAGVGVSGVLHRASKLLPGVSWTGIECRVLGTYRRFSFGDGDDRAIPEKEAAAPAADLRSAG